MSLVTIGFVALAPVFWLAKTLALYFVIVLALTIAWRVYKINWSRSNKLPVSAESAVLVTGATSGIGLAVAKHFYKLGYSVIAAYYNSDEIGYKELKQLKSSFSAASGQHLMFVELDIRREESIAKAYKQCSELLDHHQLNFYALVNNAGLGSLQPFAWLQRHTISKLIETNLLGSLLMTREFLPLLIKSRGRILNITSGLAFAPGPTYATYGVTKSAQLYFTNCLNMELKTRYGVKSVAVIPHNFVKNTNICAQNVRNNEEAWKELSELERKLYKVEFDEHCKLVKSLEKATKQHNKRLRATTKDTGDGSTRSTSNKLDQSLSLWNLLKSFNDALRGKNDAPTLEQSGALDGFEDALRLEDPPGQIFAGDKVYSLLVGSIILSMPTSCASLLGSLVSPSLYR